ncbi:MAG: hypothetical protein V1913_18225 [Fibrobacterota bacterium]
MLRNPEFLREFEMREIASQRPDYFRNLAMFEALYREAVNLGVLPEKDPLAGMEEKISYIRSLHVQRAA